MSLERVRQLIRRFRERVATAQSTTTAASTEHQMRARELLESMLLTRHLDQAAHELRAAGHGHYTICSAGHEGSVVLGRLTRPDDPTMLHYRDTAVQLERARQVSGADPVTDIALSLVASRDDPLSRGRHKVLGSRPLGIIPQTSTIASHLPRAVGLAFALERARKPEHPNVSSSSIVLASFGDASINHSTALGAFNAAGWAAHQGIRMPLLCVCEDNGLGISVRSPPGWVQLRLTTLPHFRYFEADGWDLEATWNTAQAAVGYCRVERKPAILHLRCVRLLGHAGSDADAAYRTPRELEEIVERDPVSCAAVDWIAAGYLTPEEVLALDRTAQARVFAAADTAVGRPKLATREEVRAPISFPESVHLRAPRAVEEDRRSAASTLAQGINLSLRETLDADPDTYVFGEDVAKKGGVYGITKGLLDQAGPARVFNTLLDEQTILGLALGMATVGVLPIPEIQYLAYVHNAEDQLRGEGATLRFFSDGAYDNPMIVRIAGYAYQKGFGGHFHNDNSIAVLRDIPGLIVATPARADDALSLFRTSLALAREHRRIVVMLEPIALYHTRDLHDAGDGLWLAKDDGTAAAFGEPRVYHPDAADLVIATYGNGVHMALQAARVLRDEHRLQCRIIDLRWLAPLPMRTLLEHAASVGSLLFVDECRRTGSLSEAVAAAVVESGQNIRFARITADDCFIPLGTASELILPSTRTIVGAVRELHRTR